MQKLLLTDDDGKVVPNAAALSDRLTLPDIAIYVADTAFSRGRNYQKLGRVFNFSISHDLTTIRASVLGSQPDPYYVAITLETLPTGRTSISGTCSCPMGHNCKHVAATLLEALERSAVEKEPPAKEPPAAVVQVPLPYEITAWLDQLAQSANGEVFAPEINQRLLYIITSYTPPNSAPHLAVDVLTARLLKSGEFSDSTTRPALNGYYTGNWPRYFRYSDIQICQTLQSSRNGSLSYTLNSLPLLTSIVETGRAYWKTPVAGTLSMGEPRAGRIEWVMADARGLRPVVTIPDAIALNAKPPVYVDTRLNRIGEIKLDLPPQVAHSLLNAPVISPAHVSEVSRSLARHLPSDSPFVPKPPEPAVVVDADPKPALRLMLGQGSAALGAYRMSTGDMALARLTYNYGPVPVPVGETRPIVEALDGTRRYQAKRRPTWEKQIVSQLFTHGLRWGREIYPLSDARFHQDLAYGDPYSWLDFLSRDVPRLESEGFEVIVDNDFPYRLAKPMGEIDTEIFEGARIDWFELAMGVLVEGQKLDLAPMLANLVMTDQLDPATVTAMAADGDDIYVPLDDGRHLALAAKRFLPVIIALHELTMGGSVIAKTAAFKFRKPRRRFSPAWKIRKASSSKGSTICAGWPPSARAVFFRWRRQIPSKPRCALTNRKVLPGSICCAMSAWEAFWRTTWASAKPSRFWRCYRSKKPRAV